MPSFQSRIVERLLPLSGFKRLLASEGAWRDGVVRLRRHGPALPTPRLRRRLLVSERAVRGSRVFTVAPRERTAAASRHILYLHGGGYFAAIAAAHWRLIARFVDRLDCTIEVPLYPLTPEHTWKDAFHLVLPLCRDLIVQYGGANCAVMGDSSGGGMTLALAQQMRDQNDELPSRLVLIAPWLDVTFSDRRQARLAEHDRLLDIPGSRAAGLTYAGDLAPTDPRVSPLYGSLRGLPRIAVFTGTHDLLNPDARRLKEKASREDASLAFHEYEGMFHVWVAAPIPEAAQAIEQIAEFIENEE